MTRALLVLLAALLFGSSAPYCAPASPSPRDLCVTWTVYDVAEIVTGAPAATLRGIARYESGERDDALGDDGQSTGRFQWYRPYLSYFRATFGYFDPRDPQLGTIRAGQLYMRNLAELGSADRAIAAHNQGVEGVKTNGVNWNYVKEVRARI
jgi:hypothetical protein